MGYVYENGLGLLPWTRSYLSLVLCFFPSSLRRSWSRILLRSRVEDGTLQYESYQGVQLVMCMAA